MAVSKRLRYEILRRDNYACRYCGASAPDVPLRVDHVTPVALGGTDTADNLIDRIRDDSDFTLYDLWAAAASAGAYGDTDLSTSLTRNLSVFEIAAKPLAGGGN